MLSFRIACDTGILQSFAANRRRLDLLRQRQDQRASAAAPSLNVTKTAERHLVRRSAVLGDFSFSIKLIEPIFVSFLDPFVDLEFIISLA